MEEPLPFLISIPHGGEKIPPCVQDRVALARADILEDGDAFTCEIYDLEAHVSQVIQADVARAIVDLNRDMAELPPEHADGVVKMITCYGKPVYHKGLFPDQVLVNRLIKEHYRPYHDRIRAAAGKDGIVIGLDCHSMAGQAPPTADRPGLRRPSVCLGNAHGETCDMLWLETLAACFRDVFDLEEEDVTLNDPFSGGVITRTYGANPIPWIQVEINRSLYLDSPWYDASNLTISRDRLKELRALLRQVLRKFYREIAR
ncbi:MAG: N-formylglutamate amidohydrolase [Phycisphaerales bacterium]|nr:MAG: N-formylglutamate amidohydrolase [Phycisphaerales bacterium]